MIPSAKEEYTVVYNADGIYQKSGVKYSENPSRETIIFGPIGERYSPLSANDVKLTCSFLIDSVLMHEKTYRFVKPLSVIGNTWEFEMLEVESKCTIASNIKKKLPKNYKIEKTGKELFSTTKESKEQLNESRNAADKRPNYRHNNSFEIKNSEPKSGRYQENYYSVLIHGILQNLLNKYTLSELKKIEALKLENSSLRTEVCNLKVQNVRTQRNIEQLTAELNESKKKIDNFTRNEEMLASKLKVKVQHNQALTSEPKRLEDEKISLRNHIEEVQSGLIKRIEFRDNSSHFSLAIEFSKDLVKNLLLLYPYNEKSCKEYKVEENSIELQNLTIHEIPRKLTPKYMLLKYANGKELFAIHDFGDNYDNPRTLKYGILNG
jgi:hypothetical protein